MIFANLGMRLADPDRITQVTNPQSISVLNGTAFGSIPFPSTIRAFRNGFWVDMDVTFEQGSYDSSTNGSYTLNGKLVGFGNACTIVVWVLPAPTQWFDLNTPSLYTYGVDNLNRIVTAATAKVGASITEGSANLINRPSWNGDGMWFNTQSALTWGSVSSHNTFHQDTPWSIYVVWYQIGVTNTHRAPIYCSNALASTSTGIYLGLDNRIASSNTYALECIVTKGVSGQVPINVVTADNVVDANAWNWAKLKFDGTDFSFYVNGSLEGSSTPAIAFATGNASNALRIGNLNTVGVGTGASMYLKHLYMEDSFVSGATETLLDNWAVAQCGEGVPLENASVYLLGGQSNMAGRGVSASIAPELNGNVGAKIMVPKPTPPTQTDGTGSIQSDSYWDGLTLGVNQTYESVGSQHGMEMRFGYDMEKYIHRCWIIKMGTGGTPVFPTATYNDWNISSNQMYTHFRGLILTGMSELFHVFRKQPVIRGFVWMQGETDAIITGAGSGWKTNFTNLVGQLITDIEAAGYTVNKMRMFVFRITDVGGFAYDPTEFPLIYAAQEDVGDNFIADNPGVVGKILGTTWRTTDDLTLLDPQHYDHVALDTMGRALFTYFKNYVNE